MHQGGSLTVKRGVLTCRPGILTSRVCKKPPSVRSRMNPKSLVSRVELRNLTATLPRQSSRRRKGDTGGLRRIRESGIHPSRQRMLLVIVAILMSGNRED